MAATRRASSQILRVLSSFPSLFRLQRWTELNRSSAGGRRGSGGLAMHGMTRALIARWCVDCDARFARARYSYQSHTMRALRAVANLTNALQVRTLVARHQSSRRPASRLVLEIDVGKRLPGGAADSEARLLLVDRPGRREAARRGHGGGFGGRPHQRLRLARRGVVYGVRASPPVSLSCCVMADSSFGRLGHLCRLVSLQAKRTNPFAVSLRSEIPSRSCDGCQNVNGQQRCSPLLCRRPS
jgi:hypothetical protein